MTLRELFAMNPGGMVAWNAHERRAYLSSNEAGFTCIKIERWTHGRWNLICIIRLDQGQEQFFDTLIESAIFQHMLRAVPPPVLVVTDDGMKSMQLSFRPEERIKE